MFEYFYHEIIRKTVIAFGTLFNKIQIRKKDDSGNKFDRNSVDSAVYVPISKILVGLKSKLFKPQKIK